MNSIADRTRVRIVVFCWNDPAIAVMCANLADHLRAEHAIETVFVSDEPGGVFLNLLSGYQSFTLQTLIADLEADPVVLSDKAREWILEFDELTRTRDDPPPQMLVAAYEHILDAVGASAILMWNGSLAIQRAGVHAAREKHLPCYFLERGLLPNSIVVDPMGVNYASHIAGGRWTGTSRQALQDDEEANIEAYCSGLRESGETVVARGKRRSENELRSALGIPTGAPIVLFPLQIEWDSNIVLYSPHFKNMIDAIDAVQNGLGSYEAVHVIVKPHPEDRNRLNELRRICGPRTRVVTDASVRSLVEAASVIVTINSTVGLEALTAEKQVVVLGNAIYSHKGFTHDLDIVSRLPALLSNALDAAADGRFEKGRFHEFLRYLLKHCLFSMDPSDPWGSRARLGGEIANACDRPPKRGTSPAFERLQKFNRPFLDAAEECRAGSDSLDFLLIGANRTFLEPLREFSPRLNLFHLGAGDSFLHAAKVLGKGYDIAVCIANRGYVRSMLWPLVRAKRKIVIS